MVTALQHSKEFAPSCALDCDEAIVTPLCVHCGERMVEFPQTRAFALFEAV